MSEPDFYFTIEKTAVAEYKDRGSTFLAYAYPVQTTDEFKVLLRQLKEEHPKANHHCFAYRLGNDKNLFRVSDDGEPSGSAGRPILGQIDSKQLTQIAVVVVRYFGGTLLGVPGLIHAYKTATALVLQIVPIQQKPIEVGYILEFEYNRMNDVMMVLKQYQCRLEDQVQQLFCRVKVAIPRSRLQEVLFKLKDLHDVLIQKID